MCDDRNCYVHGTLKVRGATMVGKVVSDRGKKTVIVERAYIKKIPKYKKFARARSKIAAHNPECINAKVGDTVLIGETRKISKTKSWTVIKVLEGSDEAAKL